MTTDPTGYVEHFEYITASDLDYAWLNFELDLPLLHLQAVIGHKNDKTWYDVHPVLIPLIANEKTAAV